MVNSDLIWTRICVVEIFAWLMLKMEKNLFVIRCSISKQRILSTGSAGIEKNLELHSTMKENYSETSFLFY